MKRPVVWTVLAVAVGTALLTFLLVKISQLTEFDQASVSAREASAKDRADLRQQLEAEKVLRQEDQENAAVLAEQIRALGERPVVSPTSTSQPVLLRPTLNQLENVVRGLLAAALESNCGGSCEGAPGAPGIPGIQGPAGQDGKDGKDGKPGRGIVSGPECDSEGNLVTTYDQEPLTEKHPSTLCPVGGEPE